MSEQKPLDPPMVPFAVAGIAAFALVGLILLTQRSWLVANGHEQWLWICLAGFLWGFPGLATMVVHDRHRRARLTASDSVEEAAADPGVPQPTWREEQR